ncbi:hypothetical protein HDU91_002682, partial [Kappamyces sp. JEL0680]
MTLDINNVFSVLGFFTSTAIALADFLAVREALAQQSLGRLNPFPWSMMTGNASLWSLYGFYLKNPFIYAPNIVGFSLGLWYSTATLPLQNQEQQRTTVGILVGLTTLSSLAAALAFFALDPASGKNVLGVLGCLILVAFYGAPLSTIKTVLATKDAAPISPALALASLANSVLWVVYGLAISDLFVYGPNFIGS